MHSAYIYPYSFAIPLSDPRMKTKYTVIATLLVLSFSASSALAAIRYVDPVGGSDGAGIVYGTTPGANTCLSSGSKCATIWQALQVADPGDVILVDADPCCSSAVMVSGKSVDQEPSA